MKAQAANKKGSADAIVYTALYTWLYLFSSEEASGNEDDGVTVHSPIMTKDVKVVTK